MELPTGEFVRRDMILEELELKIVIQELSREKFDGYIRISIFISPGMYKDRYLLFERGRLIGCEVDAEDGTKYGEAALESIFDFEGKKGYVDIARLEKLELEAAKEWNKNAILKESKRLFGDISVFELMASPDKDVYVKGEQLALKVEIDAEADGVFDVSVRFETEGESVEFEDKLEVKREHAEKEFRIPIKSAGTGRISVSAHPTGLEEKKKVVERSVIIKADEGINESIKRIKALTEDVKKLKERIKMDIKERIIAEGLSHLVIEEEVRNFIEEMIKELEKQYKMKIRSFVVNVDGKKAKISLEYSPRAFRRVPASKIEAMVAAEVSEKFGLDVEIKAKRI